MTHLVGGLTRLEPTEKFTGLGAGESVQVPVVHEYWQPFAHNRPDRAEDRLLASLRSRNDDQGR